MDIQNPFYLCVGCDKAINNPICQSCLSSRMQALIAEYDEDLAKRIMGTIGGEKYAEKNAACIVCGKNMNRCPHCFSKDIYHLLLEKNQIIAKEFLNRFDFGLRSYVKERK